jgi:hypothetical protein
LDTIFSFSGALSILKELEAKESSFNIHSLIFKNSQGRNKRKDSCFVLFKAKFNVSEQ